MNVTPVWEESITGRGVIVAMVDDGVDYEHDDLKANFVRTASRFFIHASLYVLVCRRFI